MNLYADIILDLWRNPQNFGEMLKPDLEAYELNPLCGDEIRLQLKLKPLTDYSLRTTAKNNKRSAKAVDGRRFAVVERAAFTGNGCAISMAAASLLTEFVKGKKGSDLAKLSEKDVISLLGIEVGPQRIKCAILPLIALKKAISPNGKKAQGQN